MHTLVYEIQGGLQYILDDMIFVFVFVFVFESVKYKYLAKINRWSNCESFSNESIWSTVRCIC
jgi:hypothetical protein